MKSDQALLLVILLTFPGFIANAQQTGRVTPAGTGYLEYLPAGYHAGSEKYPVVISLHGVREKGTSSNDPKAVMRDLPRVANVGLPKYVNNGEKYPFILISPQLKSQHQTWQASVVMDVLNHVKRTLRIDDRRIYLTGLSLGGFGVWRIAGEHPDVFAAIAPVCSGGNAVDKAHAIAKENVAVWGFHGGSDRIVSFTVTTSMVSAINAVPKKPNPLAKVTIFPGMGHDIWDKAYLETDLLRWMLSYRKGSGQSQPTPAANTPPVVNAGTDETLTLPANSVKLKGSATDSDGDIKIYSWTKVSGPDATLADAHSATSKVNDLSEGVYVFRLTATDNGGASGSDEVRVTVKGSANEMPVVNAGPDRSLAVPSGKITLQGSAEDPDGEIVSYQWAKISGGVATLSGTDSPVLGISGVDEGTYVFRLTSVDDAGGSASDEVTIILKQTAAENIAPVVNTGADKSLTLPANSIQLTASASDQDGTITSWQWTQIAGGPAQMSGQTTPNLALAALAKGTYMFRLIATDNAGATGQDEVTVIVRDEPDKSEVTTNITPSDYTGEDKSDGLNTVEVTPVGIPWLNSN